MNEFQTYFWKVGGMLNNLQDKTRVEMIMYLIFILTHKTSGVKKYIGKGEKHLSILFTEEGRTSWKNLKINLICKT